MSLKYGAVWAIDLGNNSLKALHLSGASGAVEVIGFDNIQHGKILTGSGIKDIERDELIALSLRQFVKQNILGNDDVIVSVPSQNSFARFVNLPPVEPKRIPEIVKFEAAQQIPFDINDVQWDWQLVGESESGEKKVGIFAIKNDVVGSELEHFSRENIQVRYVQMAPMALYNYLLYDRPDLTGSNSKAGIILDIGAENTDLVVCTASSVWQRTIPMGGNAFTKAVAEAFKLNFEKAEKLKRTAAMSKYARQIFQAMRPVFTDLASEIQRSLGFYSSSNPNTKLGKIIALGGGTKMRGLLKYLQQSLQMPVERPDAFKNLTLNPALSVAKFHENASDFGIVYGLALQGLGLGKIESNLLPSNIARSMAWAGKARYFTAAAGILLLVSVLAFARAFFDSADYSNKANVRQQVKKVIEAAGRAASKLEAEKGKASASEATIKKAFGPFSYREVIPLLQQTVISTLPNEKNNPEQGELYRSFQAGDVDAVLQIPRKERKQVFVTGLSIRYSDDLENAAFGDVSFQGRTGLKKGSGGPLGEGYMDFVMGGGGKAKFTTAKYTKTRKRADTSEQQEGGGQAGFVVTITGYSPYKNIGELMDPPGVENEQSKWGVITRMLHLDSIFDSNSPFELFNKTKVEDFKLEIGEVDWNTEMPVGTGIDGSELPEIKNAAFGEQVLIDPMTKEVISKVAKLDEAGRKQIDRTGNTVYQVNDHWFVLDVKFVWKDAPQIAE
jgi:type IV pilus assembly protein PilM